MPSTIRPYLPVIVLAIGHFSACAICHAENWPRFRGPTGFGYSAEKDLPLTWNGKTGENVAWKVSLEGTTGYSSPIVWGDRVFITTAARQTRQQEESKEVPEHHLACYQVTDGKLLWRTPIPQGKEAAGYAIYAVPTPATDGKAVYAWFGSAVIAKIDFDGKLLWRHERAGPFNLNPGICSSPILFEDSVILINDQNRGSGVLQWLDKETGEVKREQKRDKMGACNATPFLLDVAGQTQLIVSGTNALQGLSPAGGEPIWSCKFGGFGASPAYGNGLIYADKGSNEPALAVDPSGHGDVTATHVKWKIDKLPGDYSSPVISGDYIFRVQADGIVACLNLLTGERLFTERLEGVSKIVSPIATADGRVYFAGAGKSYVIKAGPALDVLATNELEGGSNGASAAVSNGRIFIRDFQHLYCIYSPWEKTVLAFETQDAKKPPEPGSVLFIGSSSVRLWDTAKAFPNVKSINRGFGGSQIIDSVHLADRLAIRYKPRLIVFYAGDNDIAAGKTAEQVAGDFKAFVKKVRAQLPETRIAFVSIKPSPSRWKKFEIQQKANELIGEFIKSGRGMTYVDVVKPMLGDDGQPRPELFQKDNLHMTEAGYKVWNEIVEPYLK